MLKQSPDAAVMRKRFLPVVVVAGVAWLARYAYYVSVKNALWFTQPMVDSLNYHQWAQDILAGNLLGQGIWAHSPLYAFFLAGLYKITGAAVPSQAAAFQLLVLGPLGCVMVYFLAHRYAGRAVALLAGLGAACYGPALFFEGNLLTAQLINLLNIALLLSALWAGHHQRPSAWIIPGLFLGLSALTRPNILLMLPILAAWIWLRQASWPAWRQTWRPVVWLTVTVCLLLAPSLVRNKIVLDEWLLSVGNGGLNFYLGNKHQANGYHVPMGELGLSAASQVTEAKALAEQASGRTLSYSASSRYWWRRAFQDMAAQPLQSVGLFLRKGLLTFSRYEYTTSLNYPYVQKQARLLHWPWIAFGVLAALGWLGILRTLGQWRTLFPLLGMVAVYWLSNILLLVSAEYRYALVPLLFVFGAKVILDFVRWTKERAWRPLLRWSAALLLLLAVFYWPMTTAAFRDYHLATAYNNVGATHARLGNYGEAATAFQEALKRLDQSPEYRPAIQLQLGKAYLNMNRPANALPWCNAAFQGMPKNPDAGNSLANALTGLGRFDRALQIRKQVLELDDANPEYWVNLGITHLWMNAPALADPAFAQALQLDPSIAGKLEATKQNIRHYLEKQTARDSGD